MKEFDKAREYPRVSLCQTHGPQVVRRKHWSRHFGAPACPVCRTLWIRERGEFELAEKIAEIILADTYLNILRALANEIQLDSETIVTIIEDKLEDKDV